MLRLHVPSVPHNITKLDFSHCAFTIKVLNFCHMMKKRGFEVYHYGIETSEVDATKDIQLLTKKRWEDLRIITYKNSNPELSIEEFDSVNQVDWFMPDKYKTLDIENFLVQTCPKENYERLIEEIELFRQHNMTDLLRYLKYLVDTMREHNIVWGVGRGSSVASYCLYLIGVHKIDSIKYNLDIKEFLK
jgi:DNA polymerase III alpha subunit